MPARMHVCVCVCVWGPLVPECEYIYLPLICVLQGAVPEQVSFRQGQFLHSQPPEGTLGEGSPLC